MIPQRVHESRFAWSPNKESPYGTALIDAKFTHATWLTDFNPVKIANEFRSNARAAWVGQEFATTRSKTRQRISYPLNFELSALLAGHLFSSVLGKVVTTQLDAGPPAAYQHIITLQDPLIDGLQLPSTGHWFKAAEDLGMKTKGATCASMSVAYARGNRICQLNSNWLGNGDYVKADLASIPALDLDAVLGPLFEGDLDILFGASGSEGSIKERVAGLSLSLDNGSGADDWAYGPGGKLFRLNSWVGTRQIVPVLNFLADDPDDFLTVYEGDSERGLKFVWEGETITGGYKFKVEIYVPAIHPSDAGITERAGLVVWDLNPGGEGVFQKVISKTIDTAPTGAVRASNVVTIKTTAVHGAAVGDEATIAGVTDASFNGRFYIASVPTTTTFTYAQTAADATSGAGTAEIKVAPIRVTVVNKEPTFLVA